MVILVALPLAALLAVAATVAVDRLNRAAEASDVVHAMTVANAVRGVLGQLEAEEVTSVGFLVGVQTAADVEARTTQVSDRVADLDATLGGGLPDRVRAAVDGQDALGPVRQGVSSRTQTPAQVVDAFRATITSIITSLSLATDADTSTAIGRQVLALDALLRIDAAHAAGAADLLAAATQSNEAAIVDYAADQRSANVLEAEFAAYASPAQLDEYGLVTGAYVQRLGDSFVSAFANSPSAALANLTPSTLYPQLVSYLQLGGLVEAKIVGAVTDAAQDDQRSNRIAAYVLAGAALLIALLAILLAWLSIRSVSRSLRGVAIAAGRVADRSEMNLRRVADDHTESVEHSTLEALPVADRTEVGDFARAFVRAQRVAATIVERQAAARRNLAQMTGTAGRRSAQLVARQANIIDRLERSQVDPDLLADLHRLDHITNRLRRVTWSLLTLAVSGDGGRHAADESGYMTPMALADVVKLALDEIESETRVDVSLPPGTMVVPAIIDDVVLLFAELIANAAAFSRTATRVRVFARPFDSGVSIIDEGIGMSEDQLVTVNSRLAHPERLDLATSGALGLFLVGRLARRHDLRITFEHTPGGGVTAIVDLGHHVTTMAPAETARATARVASGASIPRPRDGQASPFAGAGRGRWEPMLELDSRPFDLATFERAAAVLGTGPTWNAFEVPPGVAELPAGPSQPELPSRGMTATYSGGPGAPGAPDGFGGAYAAGAYPGAGHPGADYRGAGHPGALSDFRDDLPRAGRGFAAADPTAYFGTGSNRGHMRGDADGVESHGVANGAASNGGGSQATGPTGRGSRSSGSLTGNETDRPYAGGPFAAPSRPFAGMNRAFNDPLAAPLRPAAAGAPTGGFGPLDDDMVTFPAGGIARYVPPDEQPESADESLDGRGAGLTDAASANMPATDAPGLSRTPTDAIRTNANTSSADGTEAPLSRRVPGASSPGSSLDLASRFRTLDPDEARRLVEQFEIGVARALGETATDRVDDEGFGR
jgi:signal transduction histidine kinase